MIEVNFDELKSNIADYKDEISKLEEEKVKLEEEKSVLFEQLKKENEKWHSVRHKEDKESAVYKLQERIRNEVAQKEDEKEKEIKEKDTEIKEIKEKAQNEIQKNKQNLEKNKEELAKEALLRQDKKKNLVKEKEYFEDLIKNDENNPLVRKDDPIVENRRKKVSELQKEIETIEIQLPDLIKQIDEIDNKLEFINFDKIQDLKTDKEIEEEKAKQEEEKARQEEEKARQEEEKVKQQLEEKGNNILKDMNSDYKNIHLQPDQIETANITLNTEKKNKVHNVLSKEPIEELGKKIQKDIINEDYKNIHLNLNDKTTSNSTGTQVMEQIEKTSIIIDEKIGFVTISNTNGETKSSSIFSAQEEKKDKFKRLDIKGICKDIAGKGIASRNLYRKINPAVIQAIQNNPDLIKGYISSIYNKEELPFELTHNLEGLNLFEKLKLRKYTKAEQKSGALIKGKKFNRNKALTSGRKYNTKDEQELHELQELSNNIDEDLYDIENFFKGWDEKQFKEQFNVENSEGSIEKQAAKSASEKENIGNGSKEELGK